MTRKRVRLAHSIGAALVLVLGTVALRANVVSAVNLAYDKPASTINPRLTGLSKAMEQRVYKVTDRVYVAVGYDIANSTMVIGEDGVIIIDTVQSIEAAKRIASEFRKITDKPVKGIIYTHHHLDHIGGVEAFTTAADVKAGKVQIIAQEDMPRLLMETQPPMIRDLLMARFAYMFGAYLKLGPEGVVNGGTGPVLVPGGASIILPTTTFADTFATTVAGVRLEFAHAPSETKDAIITWMPDLKVLQSGEVLQGESFPNLYTIRGGEIRNPVTWYKSVDRMRQFPAEYLVPSHGRPVSGRENVADVLTGYRDAIQYVHDQTVRYMNKGYTPDELAERISELPPHLKDRPWLGEFYGGVKHCVRQIYVNYLGWFTGDPTLLDPLPPVERAKRRVALMGGRARLIEEAQRAMKAKDYRWVADLLTDVIRINPEDKEARHLKAEALRQLGYQEVNVNHRDWYLTSAMELDGQPLEFAQEWFLGFSARRSAAVAALSPTAMLESLGVRLDAGKTENVHQTMGIELSDSSERPALEIRRGVLQVHPQVPGQVDFILTTTKQVLARLVAGETTLGKALDGGQATLAGNRAAAETFLGFVEPPVGRWADIRITAR